MPGALTKALHDRLIGDATLAALLGRYDPPGSTTEVPCVFASDPVPEEAPTPFVVISGEISQEPVLDSNTIEYGSEIIYDIRCYADQDGSLIPIETIAARVRTLFHRQPLTVPGFTAVDVRVSGPIVDNQTDLFGRILSVRVLLDG
jgi:hypothetical protein